MLIVRRLLLSLALALGGLLLPPVIAPDAAQAADAGWAYGYTDGFMYYMYYWNGASWSLIYVTVYTPGLSTLGVFWVPY